MKVTEFSTLDNPQSWHLADDTVIEFNSVGDACLAQELFVELQLDLAQAIARSQLQHEESIRLHESVEVAKKVTSQLEAERDALSENRLIAAAPDLLAALKAVRLQLGQLVQEDYPGAASADEQARAAIAKATGA